MVGVLLVAAGLAALAGGRWMLMQRPKPLVMHPDDARLFDRSGSIMREPPRYGGYPRVLLTRSGGVPQVIA